MRVLILGLVVSALALALVSSRHVPALAGGRSQTLKRSQAAVSSGSSAILAREADEAAEAASRRILVKYSAPRSRGASDVLDLGALGLKEKRLIPESGVSVLEVSSGSAGQVSSLVQSLRRNPHVLWAEPDAIRTLDRLPNDDAYHSQWGMPKVGMPAAWDVTVGSPDVIIAVLDTGLCRDVPDFAGRIVSPYSVLTHSSEWPAWQDELGHGTDVAGVAAAQGDNVLGIAGASWTTSIMPVRVATGKYIDLSAMVEGIYWAVDHGANVINISAGGFESSQAEREAVDYALSHGVVLVASVGNDGAGLGIQFPAGYSGVIAVGASDQDNNRCRSSCTGVGLDLVAPGVGIWSWNAVGSTYRLGICNGTSFSAPLVAGVASLMLSVNPSLSPSQVESILQQTADDLGPKGMDSETGYGLLNAAAAVAKARDMTTNTTLPTSSTSSSASSTTETTSETTTSTTQPFLGFSDVPWSHHYATYINDLGARQILVGEGDGTFRPDDAVARQQFAKMIVLALALPVSEADLCNFTDVALPADSLYPDNFVAVAAARGITVGTGGGKFSPWNPISRAQAITMVTRASGEGEPPAGYQPPFGDFSPDHYAWARKAAYAGLLEGLQGVEPGYDFWALASRAEVCVMLYNLIHR